MVNTIHNNVPDICSRGYIEVDLDAIVSNARHMKENLNPGTLLVGVVKTDGYGHGAVPIAGALEPLDFLWGFAVATAEEAYELRAAGIGKPILILGYTFPYCYEELALQDIRPAVFRRDSLEPLQAAAKKTGKAIRVHIKVDTGMNRIGITPDEEGLKLIDAIREAEGTIEAEGIFTHFATADEADKSGAEAQLKIFKRFVFRAEERLGRVIALKHCSNSASILEMRSADMDLVRAGISLYGLSPSKEVDGSALLKPALSLHSRIVYIKTIHAGDCVSYGATFTADRDMRVATVPIGYGDGYPRSLSGKGQVLICGKRAPILGRICMDQFMTDVSDIPEAKEGDSVVLLGTDGEASVSAEELGELSGRFHYELFCDFSKRLPRVYKCGKVNKFE